MKGSAVAFGIALLEGANATLTQGSPIDYFYLTPLWNFADNKVAYVFPTDDGTGSSYPQTVSGELPSIIWQMESRSVANLDTGDQYMQITHELTMPILATDVIEFVIDFRSDAITVDDSSTLVTLKYDSYSCTVQADVLSSDYWQVTAEDYNVRSSDGGATFTRALDDNATEVLGGQDWIVAADDYNMLVHNCDPYASGQDAIDYACQTVRCIGRRMQTVTDGNDYTFSASDSLEILAGDAALYINMEAIQDDYKKKIVNQHDISLVITLGAMTSLAYVAGAVSVLSLAMF